MNNRKAIVTLAIGENYLKRWNQLCASNWQEYADRQGYDVICISHPLDNAVNATMRSPAWQKCLILDHAKVKTYDRVVWIDSDILINPNSPCVVSGVPEEKVGAVDALEQFTMQSKHHSTNTISNEALKFLNLPYRNAFEYYERAMLPDYFSYVMQTGVMVLSPRHHHGILSHTYNTYTDTPVGDFEMESLSYEIVKNNLIHWIDPRFNCLWTACMLRAYPFVMPLDPNDLKMRRVFRRFTRGHYQLPSKRLTKKCLLASLNKSFFLHFAGVPQYMSWASSAII